MARAEQGVADVGVAALFDCSPLDTGVLPGVGVSIWRRGGGHRCSRAGLGGGGAGARSGEVGVVSLPGICTPCWLTDI